MFGGAGLGGKVGQAAMGTAGRVLGTGLGTGVASLAQDQMARTHGSTEPIDLNRAMMAAGGGATGEWLLGVLGPKVWQTAKSVLGNGALRSEERRVGTECVRKCRSLWSPDL